MIDNEAPLDSDDLDNYSGDERIIKEAHKRWNAAQSFESTMRSNQDSDEKFVEGDAYNLWQWPGRLSNLRNQADRPMLTNNRTRQHCLQIVNDGKQNRPGVVIRPTGGGATYKAAQTLQAVIEDIEYKSRAEEVYDWQLEKVVKRGLGYIRLKLEYEQHIKGRSIPSGVDPFAQNIRIGNVFDPRNVYIDTSSRERTALDSRWGFVFDDMPRDLFREKHPKFKNINGLTSPIGNTSIWGTWITPLTVRVAEYYRKVTKKDRLYLLKDDDGNDQFIWASSVDKDTLRAALGEMERAMQRPQYRDVDTDEVQWFLIAGEKIIDRGIWPGRYIPIIRVVAEWYIIEGILDAKGHVRAMLDPQRMYNYFSSAAVEYTTLQTKSPWVAPMEAISGLESFYEQSNLMNAPVIPFRQVGPGGLRLDAPRREAPPMQAAGYIEAMGIANQEMQINSGQNEATFGMQGNEKSGVALDKRRHQGDVATFHYDDALAAAIASVGIQCVDMIPRVYDTKRIIRIKMKNGEEKDIVIDPKAPKPYEEQKPEGDDEADAQIIFNPTMGEYGVRADAGPGYATLRQEAFNALMELCRGNPQLMMIFGDLMFRSADFPLADEMAERMKRMVAPQALGAGPTPDQQQAMRAIEQLQGIIAQLQEANQKQGMDLDAMKADRSIEAQRLSLERWVAIQDRLNDIDNAQNTLAAFDPAGLAQLARQAVIEALAERTPPAVIAPPSPEPAGAPGGAPGTQPPSPPENVALGAPSPVPEGPVPPEGMPV